jgi:hypothetical protein
MRETFVAAADFVDLDRYPIDRDCQERRDLLTSAQALINADGCAVLKKDGHIQASGEGCSGGGAGEYMWIADRELLSAWLDLHNLYKLKDRVLEKGARQ